MRLRAAASLFGALLAARAGAEPVAAALRMPLSVRQSGMGGVSVAGDDAIAAWLNPAALTRQRANWAVSSAGGRLFGGDQSLLALGGGARLGDRLTMGVVFGSAGSELAETDDVGEATGRTITQGLQGGEVVFGYRWATAVAVGAGVRYIRDSIGSDGVSGVAADLGVSFTGLPVEAAATVRNVGPPLRGAQSEFASMESPRELRLGLGWRPRPSLLAAAEVSKIATFDWTPGVGVEWRPLDFVAIRGGTGAPGREWAAGFSLSHGALSLDYAFKTHVIGGSHLMSLNGSFGAHVDAPPPAPVPRLVLRADVATEDGTGSPQAGGGGVFECLIENRGSADATGVMVAATHDPATAPLSYDPRTAAGDVPAGGMATVRIPFSAGRDDMPGTVFVRLEALADEGRVRSRPAEIRVSIRPAPRASSAAASLNVAVVDLEGQGISAGEAAIASDWLRSALVSLGSLRVIERTSMQKVLAEQALQQTGCTQQDCAVKLGRVLNVRRIIVGNLGKFGGKYAMTVRVVDVENGQIVYSDQASGAGEDDLMINVRTLADRIARNIK